MNTAPGQEATVSLTVSDDDTAVALGSGEVDVLGTPAVLALAEQAAVAAIRETLDDATTSVGAWAEIFHNAPTPVGATVTATARVTTVDGRRVEFTILVHDSDTEVARVEHRRVVVDRARFA